MDTAADIVESMESCNQLVELFERDCKSKNEVGCFLGETGTMYQIFEGDWDSVTVSYPPRDHWDERRVLIHSHPSIDFDVTPSETDMSVGNHPAICGMVVVSQEMFDVKWSGKAVYFSEDGSTEMREFQVNCDGTTDGPAQDRWVESPEFVLQ